MSEEQHWVRIPGPGEIRGEGTWQKIQDVNAIENRVARAFTVDDWEHIRQTGYLPVYYGIKPPGDPAPAESPLDDLAFLAWLSNGCFYQSVRQLPDGRWAAISPLMFTHAILVGAMHDRIGPQDRWCYHTKGMAQRALDAWDGTGEPDGWHRHPRTDRRREVEIVDDDV